MVTHQERDRSTNPSEVGAFYTQVQRVEGNMGPALYKAFQAHTVPDSIRAVVHVDQNDREIRLVGFRGDSREVEKRGKRESRLDLKLEMVPPEKPDTVRLRVSGRGATSVYEVGHNGTGGDFGTGSVDVHHNRDLGPVENSLLSIRRDIEKRLGEWERTIQWEG